MSYDAAVKNACAALDDLHKAFKAAKITSIAANRALDAVKKASRKVISRNLDDKKSDKKLEEAHKNAAAANAADAAAVENVTNAYNRVLATEAALKFEESKRAVKNAMDAAVKKAIDADKSGTLVMNGDMLTTGTVYHVDMLTCTLDCVNDTNCVVSYV